MGSVLLIEDDVELLRQMTISFVSAGFDVQVATDGAIGLKRFRERPTDVVVTDILMPNREGLETIIALKAHRPDVKILAISGDYRMGPGNFLNIASHLGADAILAKPFQQRTMVVAVHRLLDLAEAA